VINRSIEIVLSDLDETLITLNYSPIYSAIGIPAWNDWKKRMITDIDLTTAEERFRELAVGKLGLRRID
jgi:hypothetical protein